MKKVVLILTMVAVSSLMAIDGATLYKKCAACHGAKGEKKSLNVGKIIQGWSKDELVSSMKGYQDGTYGRSMKALMKGQVDAYSDEQIDALAEYITTLK
ncbi:MAG: c-type cytochrome [Sulfurospirillum sp.]|nr:c-type cytochrome [Sulfurospirillum sp.]